MSAEKVHIWPCRRHNLFIGYIRNLQTNVAGIKSGMSLKIGQIGLFTLELRALELKSLYFTVPGRDRLLFIGYLRNMQILWHYKILDKFEDRPHRTIHLRVTCPWVLKSLYLTVSKAAAVYYLLGIYEACRHCGSLKSWPSSKTDHIELFNLELLALEC